MLAQVVDGTRAPEELQLNLAFCAVIIRRRMGAFISQGAGYGTTVTIRSPGQQRSCWRI